MNSLPNIVLIHCHDLGNWLSCYGMRSVPSPNLQRLAEESMVFDAAFATAPLCTPARSSLFTGLLPHQNGLMGLTHDGWRYRSGVATLPEMLEPSGYRSVLVGLQHEDLDPCAIGYHEVYGLGFLPRALEVARRVEWWMRQPAREEPFLLTAGMWEVHRPWPAEDYEPSDPALVDVPAYLPDNADTRADISALHGSIRQMDTAVGLILQALDESPYADDTLVIFTTDHGVAFPRAKSTLYDSGVQVALIARAPRSWSARAAGRRPEMVSHLDIAPTLIQLAGGTPPVGLEGHSFLSSLMGYAASTGQRELVLEKTYHDRYDPIRALRTANVKYIRNFAPGPRLSLPLDLEESATRRGMGDAHLADRPTEELYLLDEDPWEQNDVAAKPEHERLRVQMAERLRFHMRRTADPLLDGVIAAPRTPSSLMGPSPRARTGRRDEFSARRSFSVPTAKVAARRATPGDPDSGTVV